MAIWKRIKQSAAIYSGSSISLTFDESTALSNAHTLVAVVQFSGDPSDITSNSWGATPLSGSGSNGSLNYLGIVTKRGDGSTNSFTVNFASTMSQASLTLFAFEGYASLALDTFNGISAAGAVSTTIGPTNGATTATNTIAIAAVGLSGGSGGFGDWSDGFVATPTEQSRTFVAVKAFTSAGQTPSTDISWGTSRGIRQALWVIEGVSSEVAGDTTPPVVAISTPSASATISGTATVSGTASDNVSLNRVEVLIDGVYSGVAVRSGNTWSYSLNTTQYTNASHVISAVAYDSLENSASATRTVTISNSGGTTGGNPWKRVKVSPLATSAASLTLTFDEGSALDATHTLAAVVQFSGNASDITSNSWNATALAGTGTNGSANYLGMFTKQADGSTNSFTINFGSTMSQIGVTLFAFEGYASVSPDAYAVGVNSSGVTGTTAGPTSTETTVANTIAISAVGLSSNSGGFGTWSNGFKPIPSQQSRSYVAVKALTASGEAPSSSITWTTSRNSRSNLWVLRGVAPAGTDTTPPVVALTSPSDASIVTGTININATATDNVAVENVQFYAGSRYLGEGANVSGSTWRLSSFDTSVLVNGVYLLRAVVYDTSGNTSANEITITVQNGSSALLGQGVYIGNQLVKDIRIGGVTSARAYLGNVLIRGELAVVTPPVQTGVPTRVQSYGPNGTHYPTRTPWVGNTTWDYDPEVACTWSAIAAAITTATTTYPNGKVRIRVQPGTLPGNGTGSTSKPVMQNIGATGRSNRILVVPRDGVFSISHSAGFRLHNIKGVTFLGFCPWGIGETPEEAEGLIITDSQDVAFAWTKSTHINITTQALTDTVELVEFVRFDYYLRDGDSSEIKNGESTAMARNLTWSGCYISPTYKKLGSNAHSDTIQLVGGGEFRNITFIDTAIFASTNSGLIMTGDNNPNKFTTGGLLDHTMIVGGASVLTRYPQPPEAYQSPGPGGYSVAFNSKPTEFVVQNQTIVFGSMFPTFKSVTNSRSSLTSPPTPLSGAWTSDPSLASVNNSWYNTNVPKPTDAYLQSIWAW